MFLVNSRQRNFSCGLSRLSAISFQPSALRNYLLNLFAESSKLNAESRNSQALSLTYGRFFAEFLRDDSLVRLRLLASPTSVGLRYGFSVVNLRSFSRKALQLNCHGKNRNFSLL